MHQPPTNLVRIALEYFFVIVGNPVILIFLQFIQMSGLLVDPATRLPPELVSRIVQIEREEYTNNLTFPTCGCTTSKCAMVSDKYEPTRVGAVSRAWREITWAEPTPWRYIYSGFNLGDREEVRIDISLLEEWLQRTGDGPLQTTFLRTCSPFDSRIFDEEDGGFDEDFRDLYSQRRYS